MYTIKQAAARTGISVPVLRAWQRRYGVVNPERSPGGYRLYSEDDLARLRTMRALVAGGWSPSVAAASLDGPAALADRPRPSSPPDSLVTRFTEAAAAMDGEAVERLLDEMSSLGSFETIAETYLLPAMVSVGEAWERGSLDVAAEHAASHAVLRRLSAAFEAAGHPAAGVGRVLVGLPAGARHELGALAFSVAARRAGLPVTYLGADLPTGEWVEAASRSGASSAVIAVPTESDRGPASAVAGALRSAHPGLVLAAGGRAAHADVGPGVTVLPQSLSAAVEALAQAIGR